MEKKEEYIFSLNHNDQIIEGDAALVEHATQFYKELFGPSDSSDIHLDPDCWEQSEIVSEQENGELDKPFGVNEIKEVIFSMEKNTAPGPDHFPIEFYQHCWDFIKNDLVALF
jgi:hypothetical protein